MPRTGAILVAAGASTRVAGDVPKQFAMLGTVPMFVRSLSALLPHCNEAVVVAPSASVDTARELLDRSRSWREQETRDVTVTVVAGGRRRQDSVKRGLDALSDGVDAVLVHDAARPFATPELVERVLRACTETGAAVPAVPSPDTVKAVSDGVVRSTLDRSTLVLVQTPQAFARRVLSDAYAALGERDVTDDGQAVEMAGGRVTVVPGEHSNFKVTTAGDLELARTLFAARAGLGPGCRAGTGNDTHLLVAGRPLVLCGVTIPHDRGLEGHSDADVAIHAACDALLGAIAAGDIGVHFPPGDPRFKDVSSLLLLEQVREMVDAAGYEIMNIDVTITAEAPRLAPYVDRMRSSLASAAGVDTEAVSVKATTTEGVGPEGEGLAMSSMATAVVRRRDA